VLALAAQQRFESTKIQVVGITTVCGTYGAENATQNITRLLKTMKNDKVRDSFVSFYFGFLLSISNIYFLAFSDTSLYGNGFVYGWETAGKERPKRIILRNRR
jgi:hypothetical protein